MPSVHRSEDFVEVADALALQSSLIEATIARAAYKDLLCAQRTSIHMITNFASLMLFWPKDLISIIEILERKRHKILSTSRHLFDLYRNVRRKDRSLQACTSLRSHPTSIARVNSL